MWLMLIPNNRSADDCLWPLAAIQFASNHLV